MAALIKNMSKTPNPDPRRPNWFELIFGDGTQVKNSQHDLRFLLRQAKQKKVDLPALFSTCGTEDFLYKDNIAFRDLAKKLNIPLTYHEEPGQHEWGYWDRNIQKVLQWLPLKK
jgi:S-formylglutathione hydrolase FrmB